MHLPAWSPVHHEGYHRAGGHTAIVITGKLSGITSDGITGACQVNHVAERAIRLPDPIHVRP
jgi:hypothetical protein